MTFTIVTTADGTLSCLDSETGEWMHNRAGAYTEALANYAQPSSAAQLTKETGEIRLLDACYGLGYNTWVLADYLLETVSRPFTLQVVGVEASLDILRLSPQIFGHPSFDALKFKIPSFEHNIYYRTFECVFDTKGTQNRYEFTIDVANGSKIELILWVDDLRHRIPQLSGPFDFVFHDAFSAQKMPELWTADLFKHYHRLLEPKRGKLLTYSAAAAVRGGLREAGFQVGKTLALGAKQGGTIAGFEPLGQAISAEEEAYLQSKAGIPYRDSGLSTSQAEILAARKQEQSDSDRVSGAIMRNSVKRSS